MKGRDALSYCRQLLVEQKVTHVWLSVDRHSLLAALERWRAYPALDGTAVSAERWREEVEHERAKALERSSLHVKQLQKCQARLNAAEGVVAQLREDNSTLRAELAELRGHQEFNDEQLAALRGWVRGPDGLRWGVGHALAETPGYADKLRIPVAPA